MNHDKEKSPQRHVPPRSEFLSDLAYEQSLRDEASVVGYRQRKRKRRLRIAMAVLTVLLIGLGVLGWHLNRR